MISLASISEASQNISSIFPLSIISASMEVLKVVFGESEMILFLMIVAFLMKKLQNFSAKLLAEVKCWRFTFKLLPIKFLVNLKSFFWPFPHYSIFVE